MVESCVPEGPARNYVTSRVRIKHLRSRDISSILCNHISFDSSFDVRENECVCTGECIGTKLLCKHHDRSVCKIASLGGNHTPAHDPKHLRNFVEKSLGCFMRRLEKNSKIFTSSLLAKDGFPSSLRNRIRELALTLCSLCQVPRGFLPLAEVQDARRGNLKGYTVSPTDENPHVLCHQCPSMRAKILRKHFIENEHCVSFRFKNKTKCRAFKEKIMRMHVMVANEKKWSVLGKMPKHVRNHPNFVN